MATRAFNEEGKPVDSVEHLSHEGSIVEEPMSEHNGKVHEAAEQGHAVTDQ